jgi:hypothetical protein
MWNSFLMNHVTSEVAKLADVTWATGLHHRKSVSCCSALILDITDAPYRSSVRCLPTDVALKATVGLTRRNAYVYGHEIEGSISTAETLENRHNIYSWRSATSKQPKCNCSGNNLLTQYCKQQYRISKQNYFSSKHDKRKINVNNSCSAKDFCELQIRQ